MVVSLSAGSGYCATAKGQKTDGKTGFEKHCASCHPKGGNIVNANKKLHGKSLKAHGIKGVKDIIAIIRKPGPGMAKFDEKTISDKDATAIAEYILKTFK